MAYKNVCKSLMPIRYNNKNILIIVPTFANIIGSQGKRNTFFIYSYVVDRFYLNMLW